MPGYSILPGPKFPLLIGGHFPTPSLVSALVPGDYVRVDAEDKEEDGAREALYVEITQVSNLKQTLSFRGTVLPDYRTQKVSVLKTGEYIEFLSSQIQSIYDWRNLRTKSQKWRFVTRDESGWPLTNWLGDPLDKKALDHLQVGDQVRLHIAPLNGEWTNSIYCEITKIDTYTEGGINRPRKFHGIALDTYMVCGVWTHVRVGEEVQFQRSNVFEIPGWRNRELIPAHMTQASKAIIDKELEHRARISAKHAEEEFQKRQAKNSERDK